MHDTYAAASRLSLTTSVVIVYVLALVVPAVAALMAAARARRMLRRARRAHADFAARPKLAPGHATLLGTVETADGGPAIRLAVHQWPRAYRTRGGSGVRWTEIDREVEVRPFHLVLDSGERIRVRATDAVRLCDPLDAPLQERNGDGRRREATLDSGARVHAVGVLSLERDDAAASAGYRGGGSSWVLAATRRERLVLSKNPFDAMFRQKARFSILAAAAIALGVGVVQFGLADFHRLNLHGEVVPVSELSATTYTTRSKNGTTTHYRVQGTAVVDGASVTLQDETNYDVYMNINGGGGDRFLVSVPFVVDPAAHPPVAQIGKEPGISLVGALFVLFALVGGGVALWLARKNALLWWEKKLVIDVEPNR